MLPRQQKVDGSNENPVLAANQKHSTKLQSQNFCCTTVAWTDLLLSTAFRWVVGKMLNWFLDMKYQSFVCVVVCL